ncbi:MAG: DUF2911 domain-containing protein [Acidobacteria bacterium]|nr:MAG: DUF2911 domain-containing protein [Acidobacteriota bacterium]REJ99414.1 MAG: DUF2911 domain-containing protein [Acidobacteriota bacterium]
MKSLKRPLFVLALVLLAVGALASTATAQSERPKSPRGQAATQVGPAFEHWVTVDYGRPILRGRGGVFGSGEEYGKKVNAGAPVWRAGANQSTRFATEVALKFGDQTLPAGEYSLFIELASPTEWNLILSNWGAQQQFSRDDKENLWGAYGYTAEKDVVKVPMQVMNIDLSVDQLTFGFINGSAEGGALAVWWDNVMATAPFTL